VSFPAQQRKFNTLAVERDHALADLRDSLAAQTALMNVATLPKPIYEVLSQASPPVEPERSRRSLLLVVVAFGALMGAVGLAVIAEVRDTRIREPHELEKLGLPVLASVPDINRAPDAYAEAVRKAAFFLHHRARNAGPQSLVVTSARIGEGKTRLARTLSHVMTEWGESVLRVDANLRASAQSPPLLESYLSGTEERPLVRRLEDGVCTVTCAGNREDAPALLATDRMRELMSNAHRLFKFAIVDAPAVLPSVDAELLAEMADGVILVVAADRTPREDVIEAIDRLRATGGRLLGAVLMDARLDNARKEASR
jgi:Mrp family chromosome partitioning ATPase